MQWDKVRCLKVGQPLLVETAGGEKLTLTLSSATAVISPWPMQAMPPNDYVGYPRPLTTYREVLTSQTRFRETLEKFHASMLTKFMIPIIGGKDLDLHRLFVLVTSRGGFCKVDKEKRWTEVYGAFKFPSTATNSSYLVRKYYFSLLLHYERVYFLRAQAWSPSELEALRVASFPKKYRQRNKSGSSPSTQNAGVKRLAIAEPEADPEEIPAPTVIGTIESKFEVGYYITGKLGSDTLHGVLYHVPPNAPPSQAAQPPAQQPVAAAATGSAAAGKETQPKRRKKTKMDKDPNKPKGNQSAYNYFFAKEHRRLSESYRGIKDGHKNISKEIGANWRKVSAEDRAAYDELARLDRARYDLQIAAYNQSLKSGQITQPILQLPLVPHSSPDVNARATSSSHYDDQITQPILQLPLVPHSSPDVNARATSSSHYDEATVELSLGPSRPMQLALTVQPATFGPDLNVINLDDEADAVEGSASMEARANGHSGDA